MNRVGSADAAAGGTVESFAELGLSAALVRAAQELGYGRPTPVQAAAIPPALAGHDVLASAETGSGKTAAYVFPLAQRLAANAVDAAPSRRRRPQALVLVPTRELAAQVDESLRLVRRFLPGPVKVSLLHGGVSINPQLMALRGGADLVIATPGRLLDVVDHNGIDLSDVACLVLDEADRLLDGGFADELGRVLALLPTRRQSLMFSATFPAALEALATTMLRAPVRVDVARAGSRGSAGAGGAIGSVGTGGAAGAGDGTRFVGAGGAAEDAAALDVDPRLIEQRAIEVDPAQRTPLLRHLIAQEAWSRVLVFVATRYACDHVADKLRKSGLEAAAFHGDASQGARTRSLADFKSGKLRVLVATDLGARGIDIAGLPVVVNHDLPRSAVDYVHRIGRTGRAGAKGLAVSFIGAKDEAHFRLIEKRQGQRVARERVAGYEPVETAQPDAATGGVKGKRPSKKDKLRALAQGGG